MTKVQLKSGRIVDLKEFSRDQVRTQDIIEGLAVIKRFRGLGLPVLVHTVAMVKYLQGKNAPPLTILYAALHDATEAYMGDIPEPVKVLVPELKAAEERILNVILTHYDLPLPYTTDVAAACWEEAKEADRVALAAEYELVYNRSFLEAYDIWRFGVINKAAVFELRQRLLEYEDDLPRAASELQTLLLDLLEETKYKPASDKAVCGSAS